MNLSDLPPEQQAKILESRREYDLFMLSYHKEHECCPKCGSTDHSTTFMGFIMDSANRDAYKDLNNCVCSKCGDKHTYHERVKKKIKKYV